MLNPVRWIVKEEVNVHNISPFKTNAIPSEKVSCHLSESRVKNYNINRKIILYFFPDLGIHLDNGLFINRINPGSYAAKEGILTVGDRIVSVSKRNIHFFL